jgi:sortase A
MNNARLLLLQRICLGTGFALLAVWAAAWAHGKTNSERDLAAFAAARAAVAARAADTAPATDALRLAAADPLTSDVATDGAAVVVASTAAGTAGWPETDGPDMSLWSPGRVDDYQASLTADFDLPEGVLHIPKISLSVPVLQGIDDLTLNRAVGRIPGTARVGATVGNLGIAGHRDSFFRGLKDIGPGDSIRLETLWNTLTYRVEDITITTPADTTVLERTDEATLTLVTCYPFYFVGHAPQRYIVRAVLESKEST